MVASHHLALMFPASGKTAWRHYLISRPEQKKGKVAKCLARQYRFHNGKLYGTEMAYRPEASRARYLPEAHDFTKTENINHSFSRQDTDSR
jgi:hypothetical protein